MRTAVGADRHSAVGGYDLYRQTWNTKGLADRLPCPASRENGEGRNERNFAISRESSGSADKILFGYADIEKSFGEFFRENAGLRGRRKVRVENDYIKVLGAELSESFSVCGSRA